MKKRHLFQVLSIIAILAVCVGMVVVKVEARSGSTDYVAAPLLSASPQALEHSTPVFFEETHDIEINVITDGLKEMSLLVTYEYYFTDVIGYSEALNLFGKKLPFTESSFLASYDGVVTAGVDFRRIAVIKDDARRVITVTVPKASIFDTTIDNESLVVYSEKNGIGTKIDISEFNSSQVELKKKAKSDAVDRGVLEKANENALTLVRNFVEGVVAEYDYSVVVKSAD